MARIRSMKPELRTDLDVASWPIPARYAWTLLWGYLDDSGRGVDDDRLLVADLFPLDRDVTERKFATWKKLWVDGGQICRYEIDGVCYLHAIKWDQHQRINRPTGSRIPTCPDHGPSRYDSLTGSVSGSVSGTVNGSHTGSVNGSLPRAQAGAPAEQGAGSREQGREGSSRRARPTADRPTDPTNTHDDDPTRTLLDEHQTATGPLSAGTRQQLADHTAECLTRATTDQTREALRRLRQRASTGAKALPGLLPRLLDDVLAETSTPGTDDPLTHPDAQAWLAQQQTASTR